MTTQYQRGTYFERLTVNWLKREGLLVTRSAASKGLIDLAAFPLVKLNLDRLTNSSYDLPFDCDKPFVIQVKSTRSLQFLLETRKCNSTGLFIHIADKNVYKLQESNIPFTNKYVMVYDDMIGHRKDLPFIYKYIETSNPVKWELIDSYRENPNDGKLKEQQLFKEYGFLKISIEKELGLL